MIVATKPEIGLFLNTNASIKVPLGTDGTHLHKNVHAFVVALMYFIAEEEKKRLIEYFFRGRANLSSAVPKICDTVLQLYL